MKFNLPETVVQLLGEDSLNQIEAVIQEKIDHEVKAALVTQDDQYTEKLKGLLETIDKNYGVKLHRVVQAINEKHTKMLQKVAKKYEKQLHVEAKSYKNNLVSSLSNYLEEALVEMLPVEEIKEAVRNKRAYATLQKLRENLAIDSALVNESIREAVVDGKKQLLEANENVRLLERELKQLREEKNQRETSALLERKMAAANITPDRKRLIKRVFEGKTVEFINENFDTTVKMVQKKEDESLSQILKEARGQSVTKTELPRVVVEEKAVSQNESPLVDDYMRELSRN